MASPSTGTWWYWIHRSASFRFGWMRTNAFSRPQPGWRNTAESGVAIRAARIASSSPSAGSGLNDTQEAFITRRSTCTASMRLPMPARFRYSTRRFTIRYSLRARVGSSPASSRLWTRTKRDRMVWMSFSGRAGGCRGSNAMCTLSSVPSARKSASSRSVSERRFRCRRNALCSIAQCSSPCRLRNSPKRFRNRARASSMPAAGAPSEYGVTRNTPSMNFEMSPFRKMPAVFRQPFSLGFAPSSLASCSSFRKIRKQIALNDH